MAQLQTKLKGLEKEIEIEEGILKGAEKMAKVGACSSFCSCWGVCVLTSFLSFQISLHKKEMQQQLEGSRKKLEQLKQHHSRVNAQFQEAGNKVSILPVPSPFFSSFPC